VPRIRGRRPTDWERNVSGLERACWATADLAYRRSALAAVGGFDERFPRAYREDTDLGLRLQDRGWTIVPGRRVILHPVGAADRAVSLRKQAGNVDDALLGALHGRGWRSRACAPTGRLPQHAATVAAAAAASPRRRRRGGVGRRDLGAGMAAHRTGTAHRRRGPDDGDDEPGAAVRRRRASRRR
jgi:hypothetical protein